MNKNGPAVQCSLEGALREMGFKEGKKGARGGAQALADLREAQRRLVHDCAKEHGLDVTMHKGKGGRSRVGKKDIAKVEALAAEAYSAAIADAGATIAEMREMDAVEAAYLRHKAVTDAEREAEAARTEAATAKAEQADAETAAEKAKDEAAQAVAERDEARRVRDLYAGEKYSVKLEDGTREVRLGTKGLMAENERLERNNAAKRAEGERIDAANAARSAALDERDRALKSGEDRLAADRAKLNDDRAEVSRLLDGHDREATEEDYLDPAYGDRTIAEFYAHKHYWADYHANGGKPKTVHVPGLREKVKAAEEARAGYEQAAEEVRRERDALREYREGMSRLLMSLYVPLRDAVGELRREGRTGAAKAVELAKGLIGRAWRSLQDETVPEAPALDRRAWDDAIEAAKADGARDSERRAQVARDHVVRETPDYGSAPRRQDDGPSL